MPNLFDPIEVGNVKVKNRIWVSPMCQYSAVDGEMQDWHAVHYGALITGGAGLVMVEATGVTPQGRISPACLGIWTDKQAQYLSELPRFAQKFDVKMGIQLAHAGRKAGTAAPWQGGKPLAEDEGGWESVAPSAIPFGNYPTPHEMTLAEINQIRHDFVSAAERALFAGFDVIELHVAHGYLLHEFLSPISNQRSDEYGGSFEYRIRLLLEIVREIRVVISPARALFVRLSCTDWVPGGWELADSVELAKELKAAGVDLIDCSSAGSTPDAQIPVAPGFQVPFATAIREQANIMTSAVGMINDAHQAAAIIDSEQADAVMLGRAFLGNPRWPLQAAADLGLEVPWVNQYQRGILRPQ
ncbi:MAG: NADH:flavin oxidoreductase/NADH oxidase [Actinomycetales bacterium]|nr:NADH:flavin oxidoreductase/NADH oxidase [Actinomycetales bacterium]